MSEAMCSIIVPVFNVHEFLQRCLVSLKAQTYKNIEIIIVDDGSTDGSLEVCKEFFAHDLNVKFLEQLNSGQGVARNLGVRVASGEYIVFVDADDWIDKDLCLDLVSRMTEERLDFISFGLDFVTQDEKIVHEIRRFRFETLSGDAIFKAAMLDDAVLSSPVNKMYRRSFLREHSIEFPAVRACEDMYFSRAVSFFSSRTAFVSKVYYHALIRNNSTSRSISWVFFSSLIEVIRLESIFLEKNGVAQQYYHLFLAHVSKQISHALVLAAFRMPVYAEYNSVAVKLMGLPEMNLANSPDVQALLGIKHKAVLRLATYPRLLRLIAKSLKLINYSPY
ncbi:glycosyltransferase [Pseudomonas rhodesiae]|jgi:glycosyltransferase involved in cell wall biosynthesis|uniref:Glycosyltransferase n=1 Tax=Pseudomonas quebecensis TaxID=2995174 RepID=A0ABY6QC93_9PSED|nr:MULTISPECIES: glycosyltransferase [Pseudomonas]MCX4066545.1 glycosyltransferase [Pseudomonas quebecensis]UZW16959.1 glycosyltransferase [Pseudomonas quebecensis]UZW25626.1 glycosyltransferase [Pseudomonas quebecensis]UZW30689.1 glycosyltransferase [Pseudomonas quebecensis]WLH42562.1 glycosyltransferase [Pseudomonas sp. FP2254]